MARSETTEARGTRQMGVAGQGGTAAGVGGGAQGYAGAGGGVAAGGISGASYGNGGNGSDGTGGGGGGGGGAGANGGAAGASGQNGSGGTTTPLGGNGGAGNGTGGNGGNGANDNGGGGGGGVGFGGGGGGYGDDGGGGAGYGGGGGGLGPEAAGGGGSSYVIPAATGTSSSATNVGDGAVTITYDPVANVCPTTATTTALQSSRNPTFVAQGVTYTATVTPAPDGGTVAFSDVGSPISGCATVAVSTTTGKASCDVAYGLYGTHSVSARYSGDAGFTGSAATPITQVIDTSWVPLPLAVPPTPAIFGPVPACITAGFHGTSAFVCAAYENLLGRLPDTSGLATFGGLLNAGVSRTQVAADLVSSAEYRGDLVNAFFEQFLDRPAEPGALATFVGLLNAGATDQQVIADIVGSPEFFAQAGGTNAGFVNLTYQRILGRVPDTSGVSTFLGLLNAGATRAQVAGSLLNSGEYRAITVTFYFTYLLHRVPDSGGSSTFLGLLNAGGTVEQVISNIVGSNEYNNAATSAGAG